MSNTNNIPIKNGFQVEVMVIPLCDICKKNRNDMTVAYADANIPGLHIWANVCKQHFVSEGCRLGVGLGQEYIQAELEEICTSPGICNCQELSQTERIKANLKEAFAEAGPDGIPFYVLEELFEDRDPCEFL